MTPLLKARILVAAGRSDALLSCELVLGQDYSVFVAESGEETFELAGRADFTLILLDVGLPPHGGFEAAAELRRRPRTRHTPVVFIGPADASPSRALRAFALGAADYFATPISPELLKRKVDVYVADELRKRALRAQIERLTELIRDVHGDLSKVAAVDEALEARVVELERLGEELRSEAAPRI